MKYIAVESCDKCPYYAHRKWGIECGYLDRDLGRSNEKPINIPSWCPLQGTCKDCKHYRNDCYLFEMQVSDSDKITCSEWESIK